MKIGIDARFALGRRRGIGNYVLNLLREYARCGNAHEFVLYTDRDDTERVLPAGRNFTVRRLPGFYPLFEQVCLPRAAAADGVELLHCTGNTAPLFLPRNIKLVLTLHDAAYMKSFSELPLSPSNYQRLGRLYRRLVAPFGARRADAVLTVSEFAKLDLLGHFPFLRNFAVTPLAPGPDFKGPSCSADVDKLKTRYGLDGKYFIAVGGVDPQKNIGSLLRAYAELRGPGRLAASLFVVGMHKDEAPRLPLDGVLFPGYVPPADLAILYCGAEALVFPSLRESFGLPQLEAMACGAPVIAAAAGALPEIGGGASLLVDPLDKEALQAALLQVCCEPGRREVMAERGLARAGQFSWARTAALTLAAYGKAAGGQA